MTCAKIPRVETATKYEAGGGDLRGLSTANAGAVAAARYIMREVDADDRGDDYGGACRDLLEVVEKREAQKLELELRKRFNLDAMEERARTTGRECDKHSDASGAVLRQVLSFPAIASPPSSPSST